MEHSRRTVDDFGVSFPLLSDAGNEVARRYGLAHPFPEDLREVYLDVFETDLAEYNGDDSWTLPMPARYLVDTDGTIRWASVSADYTMRPDPAETLEALEEIRGE